MGHLEVIQWGKGEGCPWDTMMCRVDLGIGHVATVE